MPGVYQFVDSTGTVIYVGKAKSLRRRVSSYFMTNVNHTAKVRIMVRRITDIKHIVVESETDALLLENNLIKTLSPRYNILLKDDKTYPWIVVRNDPFPRVESTRQLVRDGSRYFGPYASGSMKNNLLELIHGIYTIRTCKLNLSEENISKMNYSVCLQYHIGNCKGPCVGRQSRTDYDADINMVCQILGGNLRSTRKYLEDRMQEAAGELRFELAEDYRRRLNQLNDYQSRSVIVNSTMGRLDVYALLVDDDAAYCNYVRIVDGAVVNSYTAELSTGADSDPVDILTTAIQRISERMDQAPAHEVIVPFVPHVELFEGVEFTVPKRGDKVKLLEFAEKSTRIYRLEKLKNIEISYPERHTDRVMNALQKAMHMNVQPRYIECFDNSNLQGTNPVASCVVFRDGKPSRKEYRHFNVKTVEGPDDFASMREIVGRRYRRLLDEGAQLPDLIIVDGGKGQLSSAYGVLKELGIENKVRMVGLAKRIEEVFFPGDSMPYYLERGSEPLKIIMHIRDEAHRFGITFHRQKRSKAFIKSEIESVSGLGKASVEKLMKRFKTVSAIRKASEDEIAGVVGRSRARALRAHFDGKVM